MKKLFLPAAVLSALLLGGCVSDGTATVIYSDVPSPLTKMTYSESLPPETYSQYMATYTPTETGSDQYYRRAMGNDGMQPVTGITMPESESGFTLQKDTAVTAPPAQFPAVTEETVTCVTELSGTESTDGSDETTETTTVTTVPMPQADTGLIYKVSADTGHTLIVPEAVSKAVTAPVSATGSESTENSETNKGESTTNADKYTE